MPPKINGNANDLEFSEPNCALQDVRGILVFNKGKRPTRKVQWMPDDQLVEERVYPRTAASPRKSKIAFKSLASSVSQPKMSTYKRKIEPRKAICNINVLNLLSDQEDDIKKIEPTSTPVRNSPCKSFHSPPSVQPEVQQTSTVEPAEDLQSEFTVDVQETFSALEPEPPRRSPRKPLVQCNKYLTPEVPRKIKSRLDKGSSSTPNLQPSREAPKSIKELISCAFGFESEDDLEERFVLYTFELSRNSF